MTATMTSVASFHDEYVALVTRIVTVGASKSCPEVEASHWRELTGQVDDLLQRWQGQLDEPKANRRLAKLAQALPGFHLKLDHLFLGCLWDTGCYRSQWLDDELFLRQTTAFIAKQRARRAAAGLPERDADFDPEAAFREYSEHADQSEREFRKHLARLEADWADRLTPEHRRYLKLRQRNRVYDWASAISEQSLAAERRLLEAPCPLHGIQWFDDAGLIL
jgi:hypothetical protein